MGREGSRQGAAVKRLQNRGLDLDETGTVEICAHGSDDPRAVHEQLTRLLACDQIQLTTAITGLHIAQSSVPVRRWPQRLGEHLEGLHPQRDLASAATQRGTIDADQIADIE